MGWWHMVSGAFAALLGYTTVAAVAAALLTRARRRLPEREPRTVGLVAEDVWLVARGEALNIAAWHLPAPGARRAVIVAHGIGGCRGQEYTVSSLELVKGLVADGITVLMLDLRGHGESDAAPMTYGLRERRDLLGAVDWLLARGYAPGAIGVLGLSMGGVAGIGAAGEEPAIGALVVDSACADYLPIIRSQFRRASRLPLAFLPGTLLISRLLTGENLARLRPAELLRAIPRRPVLIIHARGDRLVPLAHARALAAAGDAELWVVRTAQHLGALAADPHGYAQRVRAFFDGALVAPPARHEALARVADRRPLGSPARPWGTDARAGQLHAPVDSAEHVSYNSVCQTGFAWPGATEE